MTPLTKDELKQWPYQLTPRLIAEFRKLQEQSCAICHDTGKLDDAQAWDDGQEPSDCPYCPERLDELRELRARVATFEDEGINHHLKPGACMSCMVVESERDSFREQNAALVAALEAIAFIPPDPLNTRPAITASVRAAQIHTIATTALASVRGDA